MTFTARVCFRCHRCGLMLFTDRDHHRDARTTPWARPNVKCIAYLYLGDTLLPAYAVEVRI